MASNRPVLSGVRSKLHVCVGCDMFKVCLRIPSPRTLTSNTCLLPFDLKHKNGTLQHMRLISAIESTV